MTRGSALHIQARGFFGVLTSPDTQSRLTAVTPARGSLGSDLSRGAGDYAPRDKPICAISYSGRTRVRYRDEYGFRRP